jgi:hypothetical protein
MRKTMTMLAAGVALAAVAGTAQAQLPYGGYGAVPAPTATLFELPNFLGRSVVVQGESGNLTGVGFNDRARSARFDGAWTVCVDADYRGFCDTVSGAVPFLQPQLNGAVSSLRATATGGWPSGWPGAPGQVPGWGGTAETAILYEYPNFQGRSVVVTRENANLTAIGFNDRARSARFEGSWKVCEDANYRSRCETFTGAVPDLRRGGIQGASSLQMSAVYGSPGGYGQGVPGTSVIFYPGAVAAVGYGAPPTRRAADDFCRRMGNSTSVYYATAGGLSDVLCRR